MNSEIHTDMKSLRGMVNELLNVESGLSEWEIEFLDSLASWPCDFTQKQVECLEKLYKKVLG